MSYFLECYTRNKSKAKVELDLSNYAKKSNLKNASGIDTSKFVRKLDLANLKSNIDKLEKVQSDLDSLKSKVNNSDVDNLKPFPICLKKLSDVVDK